MRAVDYGLLYFYFTFTDIAKQALEHAIRALGQPALLQKPARAKCPEAFLDTCFALHNDGKKQPSVDTLCRALERDDTTGRRGLGSF